MSDPVEYFYTTASPWTYLGHALFLQLAREAGVRIVHKPVDIGAVFEVSGGLPLGKRAVQRRRYRLVELQRWRAYRNRELILEPKYFPVDPNLANRMVIAAQDSGADADGLAEAIMRAVWAEERNIADPAVLKATADAAGCDGNALLAAATDDPETAATYQRLTEEAKAKDVFGAPTYIYRGEPFWGQDRLEFLARALNGETAPIRPAGG